MLRYRTTDISTQGRIVFLTHLGNIPNIIPQIRFHELMNYSTIFKDGPTGFPAEAEEKGHIFYLYMGGESPAILSFDIAYRLPDQQLSGPGMAMFSSYGQPPADPVSLILIGENPDRTDDLIRQLGHQVNAFVIVLVGIG